MENAENHKENNISITWVLSSLKILLGHKLHAVLFTSDFLTGNAFWSAAATVYNDVWNSAHFHSH